MEAYCVKCKRKNEVNDAELVTFEKTGRSAIRGTCAECGTAVFRIISKGSAEQFQATGTL